MTVNGLVVQPSGWAWTTINEITEPCVDQGGPRGSSELLYVDIGSIDNRAKQIVAAKKLRVADAPSRARQRLEPCDVLVSMTRPNLNAVALVPPTMVGAIGSTGFHVLRTRWVEPRWLFYFVQTTEFIEAMSRVVQGALYPAVRPKDIASYRVPVAPLAEQRRIVAEIEKQVTRLDAAGAALRRVQANLKRYRAAVLKGACEGRLVPTEAELARAEGRDYEPGDKLVERILARQDAGLGRGQVTRTRSARKGEARRKLVANYETSGGSSRGLPWLAEGWAWARVQELTPAARSCAYGILQPGSDVPDGVPLIRVGDIGDGQVGMRGLKRVDPRIADRYPRTKLRGGEVLMSLVGAIGRTAVVPPVLAGANTARAVGVIPVSPEIEPRWVEIWFRNPSKTQEMVLKAHEVARKTLNLEDVRGALVAVPPAAEQRRIISEVERRLSVVAELESAVEVNMKRADRLRQAILRRAFEGRLVSSDPSDEPATVLLERVRAECRRFQATVSEPGQTSGTDGAAKRRVGRDRRRARTRA